MTFVNTIADKIPTGKTIILPETEDERVIAASAIVLKEGFCKLLIIAKDEEEKTTLISQIKEQGATDDNFSNAEFVLKSERIEELSEKLAELRKAKGMTIEQAKELLENPNNLFFANMLLKLDEASGIVAGSNSATADVIRSALQVIRAKPGLKTVSSYFVMHKSDAEAQNSETVGAPEQKVPSESKRTFIYSDCGLNINPTSEQLADIAISSAESARLFGLNPKVALLSCSTKGSAKHPDVDKVVEAKNILDKKRELCEDGIDFDYEGELQLDAAIMPSIAEKKCPDSTVKGDANVLIFPDLDAGNIAYKITQRIAGYEALGPLIQGLAKPVNDLSRGCSVDDIVNVAKITLLQSTQINTTE